ncbi:hypothetical protein H4R18_001583 [Coemansia javaensis]|uniref:RING-type domain-containing protein n=1 Tax=Coemansia javaensis TaxID=2761396 RepID=A0A9W8HHQ7_9FUNG|nr:hypothetical protein H4R18_001583 [Coemansia javaensis]
MRLLLALAALTQLAVRCTMATHIRKDLVQIKDDTIAVVEATTTISSSSGRIRHLPISPAGPLVGTRGIVYFLPDPEGCQPVRRSKQELAESYIRVALIADDGDCPMAAKVAQAQFDGAAGALVYNSSMSAPELSAALSAQLAGSRPDIPIVAVDLSYGETLRLEVATLLDEAWGGSANQYRAIFVSIHTDDGGAGLGAWEITLISLVVVLALGFCASLLFHVLASRRRRRTRHGRQNGFLGKRIETLPSCALDRLVLRTVSKADVKALSQCTTPLDNILNPSMAPEDGASALAGQHQCGDTCGSSETPDPILNGCIATCIVCIDDFVVGSKMRILPCGHNYHIECIDPWLTAKSSLCPLCKYDTRNVLTDLERAHSGPQILADLRYLEDNSARSSFDDSQPSSYLAESRPRLPLAATTMRHVTNLTRKIAAPVQALTSKVARSCRRGPRNARGDDDAAATAAADGGKPAAEQRYTIGGDDDDDDDDVLELDRHISRFGSVAVGVAGAAAIPEAHSRGPAVRAGDGGDGPIAEGMLRSSDSLSDTKIFVLLAAIVFVFLLALGVAMARVSRGRRRQHESIQQQIAAASAPPQTLSKTILDMLPVFEVTEKRQLQQIQMQTPRIALSGCFDGRSSADEAVGGGALDTAACGCSTSRIGLGYIGAPMGGYGLDSGKSSLRLDAAMIDESAADSSQSCDSDDEVLAGNQGAVELSIFPGARGAGKRGPTPPLGSERAGRLAADSTPPVALRYYGRDASRSATPAASGRHSTRLARWDDGTPDVYVRAGVIAYRGRSTQSLDLSPDRASSGGATQGQAQMTPPLPQWPRKARLASQSHPEITHGTPQRTADDGNGDGGGDGDGGLGSCPICLEEFEPGEHLRELPCMHKYHVACIDTWLVSRSTCCPYCKLDICRWYYGPDGVEDAPRAGPLEGDVLASTAPGAGGAGQRRRGRRLRRIRREDAGPWRLAQAWRELRGALG